MSDIALNLDTNDLLLTNGDLSIVDNSDAIQQDLQQSLQLYLGEWFLNTTKGIPYKQQILIKNPNIDLVQADLVSAAMDVPGVTNILDFELNYDSTNRSLSVFIEVQTSNGQVISAQTQVGVAILPTIQGTPK